jgi:hypothetical protein
MRAAGPRLNVISPVDTRATGLFLTPYPGFCKHVDKKMEAELKGELKPKKII